MEGGIKLVLGRKSFERIPEYFQGRYPIIRDGISGDCKAICGSGQKLKQKGRRAPLVAA
jgi:hypothetical protein